MCICVNVCVGMNAYVCSCACGSVLAEVCVRHVYVEILEGVSVFVYMCVAGLVCAGCHGSL